MSAGPLQGIRIVEMGGIGPGPFAATLLADNGAEVVRVDRPNVNPADHAVLTRSRLRTVVDAKTPQGLALLKTMIAEADGLIEGFRPGVMERLGLGPEVLMDINPRLVFGRMTGWGQVGPYAPAAGHDINYIALSGALHLIGRRGGEPVAPPALVGDFGGGGMLLAFSMTAALLHASKTGEGEVIDCAITDGAGFLTLPFHELMANGSWLDERGVNYIDSGAHFYDVFETQDAKFISIGAIEPQFYAQLRALLGLDDVEWEAQWNRDRWAMLKQKLVTLFRGKSRDEWCVLLDKTDICFAPVLSLSEAAQHEHGRARNAFVEVGGVVQPAPVPKYARAGLSAPRGCIFVNAPDFQWQPRR